MPDTVKVSDRKPPLYAPVLFIWDQPNGWPPVVSSGKFDGENWYSDLIGFCESPQYWSEIIQLDGQ